jgi:hypothetical protein
MKGNRLARKDRTPGKELKLIKKKRDYIGERWYDEKKCRRVCADISADATEYRRPCFGNAAAHEFRHFLQDRQTPFF